MNFNEKDSFLYKCKELYRNTIIFGTNLVLSKIILSLLIPIYTRYMTVEQYGIADLITTVVSFIVPICSFSVHEAVYRFALSSKYDKRDVLRCGINVAWLSIALICAIGMIAKEYKPISKWVLHLIFISVLTMFRNILSLFTKADNHVMLFGIDSIICNFTLGMANLVFLIGLSLGIEGYFMAVIVSLIVSITLLSVIEKIALLPKFIIGDGRVIKLMLKYSIPLVLNSISWILMSLVDRVMLISIYTSDSNGIYSIASKIPSLLTIIVSVFTQAWGITLVKDYEKNKDERFYNDVYNIFNLIVLLGTSGLLLFTNNIFKAIIGERFSESVKYIGVLMLGAMFLAYSNFFSSVYSATKDSSKIAISSVVGLIFNIVMNMLLIPQMGIFGACIATTGSYILIGVYRMIDCKKYIAFKFDILKWIMSIIFLIIQCIFVSLNHQNILVSLTTLGLIVLLYRDLIIRNMLKLKQSMTFRKVRRNFNL